MSDDVSGRTFCLVGVALFVVAIIDPLSVIMTDEELAENNGLHFLLTVVPFWGGIIMAIVGARAWRRDRRVAHGEPRETVDLREQRRQEIIALSYWTGVKVSKIYRELKGRGITTADWAREHGSTPPRGGGRDEPPATRQVGGRRARAHVPCSARWPALHERGSRGGHDPGQPRDRRAYPGPGPRRHLAGVDDLGCRVGVEPARRPPTVASPSADAPDPAMAAVSATDAHPPATAASAHTPPPPPSRRALPPDQPWA